MSCDINEVNYSLSQHAKAIRRLLRLHDCEIEALCAVIDNIIIGDNINMTDEYMGKVAALVEYYNREDLDYDTK